MKARLAASIALVSALLVGTTGCTLVSINGTLKPYQPSDGAAASVGDLKLRNVLGLSDDGTDVALVFSIVNEGTSDETVTVQFTDGDGAKQDSELDVPAGESVAVGHSATDQLVLRGADVTVGATIDVYFYAKGESKGTSIAVPVLDGTQLEYADLLPGPAPKPKPVASPSASPSAEPAE